MRPAPFLILALAAGLAAAWSKEDHEIFRLKDELAKTEGPDLTFYDFLGATGPSATQDELTKAYKKTSRMIHPDKFIKPSSSRSKPQTPYPPKSTYIPSSRKLADERFARLGLVATILKGAERERYDHFLRNGWPAWRGTGYYYSRFRPGLVSVLLGLWLTIGGGAHYLLMYLNQRQQKQMMIQYISEAKTAAWGKDAVIPHVNLDPTPIETPEAAPLPRNRKERREQEKAEAKAEKKGAVSGKSTPARTATPTPTPTPAPTHVAKRKVTSDNGKTFMVTSLGDVSLVGEDGKEYLLDPTEIPGPEWTRTAVVRAPVWAYNKVAMKLGLKTEEEFEEEFEGSSGEEEEKKVKSVNSKKKKVAGRR